MFGGGVSSSLAGSSVAEKNLDRYTVAGRHRLVRLHRRSRPLAEGCAGTVVLRSGPGRRLVRGPVSPGRAFVVCNALAPDRSSEPVCPRRQERAVVASGNAIRGTRVGSGPMRWAERGEQPRADRSSPTGAPTATHASRRSRPTRRRRDWDCPRCGLPGRPGRAEPAGARRAPSRTRPTWRT